MSAISGHDAIDALAALTQGWLDGDRGAPIASVALERGRAVVNALSARGVAKTHTISPTEEGGVTFFWPDSMFSIDVLPSGGLYLHSADIKGGTFVSSSVPADTGDISAALEPWIAVAVFSV